MPGVTDFLFGGTPPPSTTAYGKSTSSLPTWLSDYYQGLLAKSNAVAGEAYQPYAGPTVAPLTGDQEAGFAATRAGAGATKPRFDAAGNLIQAGGAASGLDAAQPYLDTASESFPGAAARYLSPYTSAVTDRIAELGNRNLMEKILPGISDQFVGAGQLGSKRQSEFTSRAVRDTAGEIAGAQAGALEQGYNTAGQLFGADAARTGALGATAGNLASNDATRAITAGGALSTLGTTEQGANLKDAAALEAIGAEQRGVTQSNLDAAHAAFNEERDYPKQQAEFLNAQVHGLTAPTSTSTTTTGPASNMMGPSPLAQVAGGATGLAALLQLTKAKGGRVRFASGGSVPGAIHPRPLRLHYTPRMTRPRPPASGLSALR